MEEEKEGGREGERKEGSGETAGRRRERGKEGSGKTAARKKKGGRKEEGRREGDWGGSKKNPPHLSPDGADLLIVGGFGGIT